MGLYELCSKRVFRINEVVEGMTWIHNAIFDIDYGVIYIWEVGTPFSGLRCVL